MRTEEEVRSELKIHLKNQDEIEREIDSINSQITKLKSKHNKLTLELIACNSVVSTLKAVLGEEEKNDEGK